jgi:hypothetical protein
MITEHIWDPMRARRTTALVQKELAEESVSEREDDKKTVSFGSKMMSKYSLHSDPPVGTDVPTFADPCRGASIQAEVGLRWSSMSAYMRAAHVGRSQPTVVCLSWPTLADLSPPIPAGTGRPTSAGIGRWIGKGRRGLPIYMGLRSKFRSLLCSPERAEWLYS